MLSGSNLAHLKQAQKSITKVLKAHKTSKGANLDPNKSDTSDSSSPGTGNKSSRPASGDDGTQNSTSGQPDTGLKDGTGTRSATKKQQAASDILRIRAEQVQIAKAGKRLVKYGKR